jgi:transcriptional regulator with XRE-family HTH domain
MAERELKRLREVLAQVTGASRAKTREIERAMGVGSGYLAKLLDGTLEIKVRHLVKLAQFLEISPVELMELGFPEEHRNARFRVADWTGPRETSSVEARSFPKTTEDLKQMMRELLREERTASPKAAPKTNPGK